METHKELVGNIFKVMGIILGSLCLWIFKDFGSTLKDMQQSVNKLNVSFATMSEKMVNNSTRNNSIERRVVTIEKRLDERTKDRWTKLDQSMYAIGIEKRLDKVEGKK